MRPERLEFVGRAREHMALGGPAGAERLEQVFPGDPLSQRAALKTALEFLRGRDLGQDICGQAELVMAEALNNVIEHAYAGHSHGVVEMTIVLRDGMIEIRILDDGLPMPGGTAPTGQSHDLTCAVEDLPEGGFGWFLIRELTQDLVYERCGNRNRLEFRIDADALAKPQ